MLSLFDVAVTTPDACLGHITVDAHLFFSPRKGQHMQSICECEVTEGTIVTSFI